MKYIFIVNELAGKGEIQNKLKEEIKQLSNSIDCMLYTTKNENDATTFVKKYLNDLKPKDEKVCFIACGGDGTINEVFNGAYGNKDASVCVYPCGSGNDFVKVFPKDFFTDLNKITSSYHFMKIDLLKMGDRYSNNVINFGFDTTVAKQVNDDRKKTGHGNKLSYVKGIVKALKDSMKTNALVYADDELLNPNGELLLCSFANGQYYGGSFRCAPNAKLNDGLIEVLVVKPISRLKLISLIKHYIDGTHLENDKFKDIMIYRKAKKIKVKGNNDIAITIDGEIVYAKEFDIEIIPNALDLLLPEDY